MSKARECFSCWLFSSLVQSETECVAPKRVDFPFFKFIKKKNKTKKTPSPQQLSQQDALILWV